MAVSTVSVLKYCFGNMLLDEFMGIVAIGGSQALLVTMAENVSVTDPFVTMLDAIPVTLKMPKKLIKRHSQLKQMFYLRVLQEYQCMQCQTVNTLL